ncbi:MAG TPA: fumarylacetoacetate hydrolase family protein [Afipia sp.]
MRFVTFRFDGFDRAGLLEGDGSKPEDRIIDLAHSKMRDALLGCEPQVASFLAFGWDRIVASLRAHCKWEDAFIALGKVQLLAPLPQPKRIFGIAHNYRDALAERGMPLPTEPVLFMKEGATVIGPNAPVVLPAGVGGVTYEAEVAAVIGRAAKDVKFENALDHVAAYGVFNDVSASEMIRREGSLERGKNLPTFGPFGPFLATVDEIPDPQALDIGLTIDGHSFQNSSTSRMLFSVADLISILSHQTELLPGDVIATGTPAGVAPVQKPPTWIRSGTTMTAWVENLGTLNNPVIDGPSL